MSNLIYVLIPFFTTDTIQDIESKSMELLGLDDNDGAQTQMLHRKIIVHELTQNRFAIEIKQFNLHFMEINSLLEQHEQTKRKLQLYESLLKDYQPPMMTPNTIIDDNNPQSQTQQSMIKKMRKYKQLKQQNKKLKKLLQVQLQNTQKVREQTQKTMKVLREQFDALVVEISRKQKGVELKVPYQCHSNPPEESKDCQQLGNNSKERHSQSGSNGGGSGKQQQHVSIR